MAEDKLLRRMAALLRQAESTDNEHEAEAFMAAAQRLATESSIDLAVARAHAQRQEQRSAPIARRIEIGPPGKRALRTFVQLFLAIARANGVTCDLATNSTYVLAYGFESDIDTCEALYASLLVQMVRASDRYLRSGEFRSETQWVREQWDWVEKPVHGSTARISFQTAFATRIGERLAAARDEATAEVVRESSSGTELVLAQKALEVADFYGRTSQARGSWRGWQGSGRSSSLAERAGRRAADAARTSPTPELGGSGRAIAPRRRTG